MEPETGFCSFEFGLRVRVVNARSAIWAKRKFHKQDKSTFSPVTSIVRVVGERPCENKKEKKERSSERFYINNITSLEQIKIPGNNPQMKYANVLLLPQRRIQSFLRPWLELLHQGTGLDIPSYLYKQVKGLQFTSKRGYVTRIIGWFSNRTGTSVDDGKSARKGLNATSSAQFAALPLVKPVVWFARAGVNWRSRSVAKSA